MSFAIELHLDDASTSSLASLWKVLQGVAGTAHRGALGVQPHVSLAVLPEQKAGLELAVRRLASRTAPFDLNMGAVNFFPGDDGVVFIEATPSAGLLQIHGEVTAVVEQIGAANSPLYEAPHWCPHCTVAKGVAAGSMQEVMSAAKAVKWPTSVTVTALCGVSYRPATLTFRAPLNPPDNPVAALPAVSVDGPASHR